MVESTMVESTYDWNTLISVIAVFVQIIGFGVAFIMIQFQFKKQRRIEKENFKNSVNIDFYHKLIVNFDKISFGGVALELSVIMNLIERGLNNNTILSQDNDHGNGTGKSVDLYYTHNLDNLHKNFEISSQSLSLFISTLSNYSFVSKHVLLFECIIAGKLDDFVFLYLDIFNQFQKNNMIRGNKEFEISSKFFYNDNGITAISDRVKAVRNSAKELDCLLNDIRIEFQNELLSKFYDKKIEHRIATDNDIVLTSQDSDMIKRLNKIADKYKMKKV